MGVVKVIELVGSSPKGWEEAAQNAVNEAAKTVRNIKGFRLLRCSAKMENNRIVEYCSRIKVAFVVDRET